jgi:CheY-like chemotaxis protein
MQERSSPSSKAPPKRPRVVCVDDEPHVVGGLALHLRRRYDVELATSGQAGLELLDRRPEAAVVISDMRMPGMNGAEFLAKASAAHPNTTRILLTGYAEIDAAISAINDGRVFRFLVKPCPPPDLLRTVEAGAELHRLLTTEQELLERTLHGSIRMLSEVMAVTNPAAFGRATRIKQRVTELATELAETQRWQVEVAAMLSQLSSITLPNETVEKLYYGSPLTQAEQGMIERAPNVTEQLLGHIPRLEVVRQILAGYRDGFRKADAELSGERRVVRRGAQLLKAAIEIDTLEGQGLSGSRAQAALKAQADYYDPAVLEAALAVCGGASTDEMVHEVSLAALKPGMVFATDVKLTNGTLFVARGYEVTESFLARIKNFRAGSVKEPVRVVVRATEPA